MSDASLPRRHKRFPFLEVSAVQLPDLLVAVGGLVSRGLHVSEGHLEGNDPATIFRVEGSSIHPEMKTCSK